MASVCTRAWHVTGVVVSFWAMFSWSVVSVGSNRSVVSLRWQTRSHVGFFFLVVTAWCPPFVSGSWGGGESDLTTLTAPLHLGKGGADGGLTEMVAAGDVFVSTYFFVVFLPPLSY